LAITGEQKKKKEKKRKGKRRKKRRPGREIENKNTGSERSVQWYSSAAIGSEGSSGFLTRVVVLTRKTAHGGSQVIKAFSPLPLTSEFLSAHSPSLR
jgi:hypothetical protein